MVLTQFGLVRSPVDYGCYSKGYSAGIAFVLLSTDDFLGFFPTMDQFQEFCSHLSSFFKIKTNTKRVLHFLNLRFTVGQDGISIDQTEAILEFCRTFWGKPDRLKTTSTLFRTDSSYEQDLASSVPASPLDLKSLETEYGGSYRSIYGSLLYFSNVTRLDIMYAMCRLGKYIAAPTRAAFQGLQKICRYLASHPHRPLSTLDTLSMAHTSSLLLGLLRIKNRSHLVMTSYASMTQVILKTSWICAPSYATSIQLMVLPSPGKLRSLLLSLSIPLTLRSAPIVLPPNVPRSFVIFFSPLVTILTKPSPSIKTMPLLRPSFARVGLLLVKNISVFTPASASRNNFVVIQTSPIFLLVRCWLISVRNLYLVPLWLDSWNGVSVFVSILLRVRHNTLIWNCTSTTCPIWISFPCFLLQPHRSFEEVGILASCMAYLLLCDVTCPLVQVLGGMDRRCPHFHCPLQLHTVE